MTTKHIRPIAIGLIWNGDALLVEHGVDSIKGTHFFRPPGGGIEFGERAIDALQREFLEELHAELIELKLITVMENLFQYEGQPGHELVFVFEAKFRDPLLYQRSSFLIEESSVRATASWVPLAELVAGDKPFYPEGLAAILRPRG